MGRAPGGAKGTSDPSTLPTDPPGRIRHEFRTLGSSLDRFDARVKSALRKIPGSRVPPSRADARASRAASAPKPSLFDRLRNGAKGNASATREPETASRGSRKENTTTKRRARRLEECAESRRAGGPAQRRSTETSGATAEKGSLRGEGSARGREVARGRLGGERLHLPFVRAEG